MKQVKLSEFLKEQGAYEKFVNNFDIEFFKVYADFRVNMSNAFGIYTSKEGEGYWSMLQDKWAEIDDDLKVYDMDTTWLLDNIIPKLIKISSISVIYSRNNGYEALYLDNEQIEEGTPLNEGQERVLYFINICDKYNFNIKDIKFGYCVCEEFPLSLLELDDINWEN